MSIVPKSYLSHAVSYGMPILSFHVADLRRNKEKGEIKCQQKQGAHVLAGMFAKSTISMANLRSPLFRLANMQFSLSCS